MNPPAPDDHAWFDRLLEDMERLPLIPEQLINNYRADPNLTPKERMVLLGLSHGLGNQGTADTFGITIESVKHHLKGASFKMRAKNTVHAVAQALRSGAIS